MRASAIDRLLQGVESDGQGANSSALNASRQDADMDEVGAIAGQLMSYKSLADGTLRISIDLSEAETKHFHQLFQLHVQVAVAPMNPVALAKAQEEYGESAKALWLSGFFGISEVWKAAGSDEQFLEFVRTQKCIARSGHPCGGPVQAAHVWRQRDGFGKGVKGPYAAVPLCAYHHRAQHNSGEDAVGGRSYMEQKRYETVREWVWFRIKDDIGVASMRDAPPEKVLSWARTKGIEQHLPAVYRDIVPA